MSATALVFDLKRYAVYDGPGIRTTVFFKGCNLRCAWCQNPESIDPRPELVFEAARCIGCGRCATGCAALDPADGKRLHTRCTGCGACADACPTGALRVAGKRYTAQELLRAVEADRLYYEQSGGGVTCSGGEAMLHGDFLADFLALCRAAGLHTCIDTAGHLPWQAFERLLPLCDLFLYDLKLLDPGQHRASTGVDNEDILANARALYRRGAALWVRIPLIPGVTDTDRNLRAAAQFVRTELPRARVQLLPYNPLAETKYQKPSWFTDRPPRPYSLPGLREQTTAQTDHMLAFFTDLGLDASLINRDSS